MLKNREGFLLPEPEYDALMNETIQRTMASRMISCMTDSRLPCLWLLLDAGRGLTLKEKMRNEMLDERFAEGGEGRRDRGMVYSSSSLTVGRVGLALLTR